MIKKLHWFIHLILFAIILQTIYLYFISEKNNDYRIANETLRGGDFSVALLKLLPFAEDGDYDARYHIGQMYAFGTADIARNRKEAEKWFRCEPDVKGCVPGESEYYTGLLFLYKRPYTLVPLNNYIEARYWMEVSYRKGFQNASKWLAFHDNILETLIKTD